ncbi:MAG: cation transporter [Clostridia bacterium]|nr:cation transporter [Clostridia bacterium]
MELIFKIFIKDKDNLKNPKVRFAYGTFGSIMGIVVNFILFVFKLTAGILSGSISIIADAVNNLSDAGSSVITLTGFHLAKKPASKDHPFGHGRIEYISAVLVSLVIILMGFELFKSSIGKIITPSEVHTDILSLCILIGAIIAKTFLFFFYRKIALKINSDSLHAASKDSLSDCISTGTVLLGILVSWIFSVNIDAFLGLAVSVFILYTGISTIKDSLSPLLGEPPTKEMVDEIEKIVMDHDEICGIHDLIIHNYGPDNYIITLHAEVPASGDILLMHDKIDHIERELGEKLGCMATIHMDPIETDNEQIKELKDFAESVIKEIDPILTLHDFRAVIGNTHTNLIFDLIIPHNYKMSGEETERLVSYEIHRRNTHYFAVVQVEQSYV